MNGSDVGKSLKILIERLSKLKNEPKPDNSHRDYGCLCCKNFCRQEGYDQQWGRFIFCYFKCKKQPIRNMYNHDNTYDIFDIEPDYSPNFHYNKAKGECPYFDRGENELVYMSEREKQKCLR